MSWKKWDREEKIGYGFAIGAVGTCVLYVLLYVMIFMMPALLSGCQEWRNDMRDIQQLRKQIREG